MGSWMLDMVDNEQELMGVQCVLDHVASDIRGISMTMEHIKNDIDRLNDPESWPMGAYSDDSELIYDFEQLYIKIEKFKSKYKKDLAL